MNKLKELLLLLIIFFSSSIVSASDLHVIMVCDTTAKNIENGVHINMQSFQKEVADIAYYADMKINLKVFYDLEANHLFVDYIKNLKVDSDDAIIFYWSGHGYRTESKDSPWPNFAFENDWTGIDQLAVTQLIEKKNPRLLLSITDTCNSILPEEYAPPLMNLKSREFVSMDMESVKQENYKKLFIESTGTYITAASIPGQYSYANNSYFGGLWTYSFIEGLHKEVKSTEIADWNHLFIQAEYNLSGFSVEQTPMYDHWN